MNQPKSVFAADLDGDGDQDVLATARLDDAVAWFENTDGAGSFGPALVITNQVDAPVCVRAADVDGDGDQDVLTASASGLDDTLGWYENTDGAGTFGSERVITSVAAGVVSIHAADVDGDGDLDVLSASWDDDTIAWYENVDGLGAFGPRQVITTLARGANSVVAVDLDGDLDLDAVSGSHHDNIVSWYENTDGQGTFGSRRIIPFETEGPRAIFAADLDGDGDRDLLSASESDGRILWFRNSIHEAMARFRNDAGHTNPTGYLTSVPVLGADWIAIVDNTGSGNFVAGVMGYTDPLEQYFPKVDGYLLIDPLSPGGELLQLPPAFGYGLVTFSAPVPDDVALIGFTLSTQGAGAGGANHTILHNAYDLELGR